ncbi:MAG: N-acetyl sugar amidotransferase, partial [Gemmatimonadales bacterium]
VKRIREDGKGKRYDCVIGLSGGVDSTFLAYKVKSLGLRPVAVHLDNGWDTEIAVKNIQNAVARLEIDLITHVLDWEEFRDLQTAFLRASTPDSEIPSDHAITAVLAQTAAKVGARTIISGANHRTESHLPLAWSSGHLDWLYIKTVHRQFGKVRLKTFPRLGFFRARDYMAGTARIDMLDYLDYAKSPAIELIQRELGWQNFSGKHHESIYTRFYQGYILPTKFGYDKRKAHLSSLVCSGEMSRDAALHELKSAPYAPELQRADIDYVTKKLELTKSEFDAIMNQPPRSFWDFPSYARMARSTAYRNTRRVYRAVARRNMKPVAPSAT